MDEHGLREQLEKHHSESFGWALCCCGRDRVRAEEALQRTYLKVLENKARFEGRGSFKTWLFAVIRTTARDERRREALRRIGLLRYEAHSKAQLRAVQPATQTPAEQSVERARLQAVFVTALAKLPGRQRQTLQLVFYHDMTLAEAASVMGVSLGSARTHYERAKAALRLRLGAEGIGP
jgi:RNA polymerase sigma-70 factor (ECF subfamily)